MDVDPTSAAWLDRISADIEIRVRLALRLAGPGGLSRGNLLGILRLREPYLLVSAISVLKEQGWVNEHDRRLYIQSRSS